ncbi:MAG: response regulator transcription factor [Pararheinheimera sp.]|nr:response regulator transcription factor [Rheinheimera sp.]
MSKELVVYVVDDDESLRYALEGLLNSMGYQTQSFAAVAEFLQQYKAGAQGCLILDVRLPGLSGLSFQAKLQDYDIQLPVILMTGHGDIPMSVRAMKAGAVDFLTKPFRDQDMLDAVASAMERIHEQQHAEKNSEAVRACFDSLTSREKQVMTLVCQGKMNKQIAWELQLSEVTIKIHRGSAMRKMQAKTLADLVKMAEALHLS